MLLAGGDDFGLIPWVAQMLGGHAYHVQAVEHYYSAALAVSILSVLAFMVWRRVRRPGEAIIPPKRTGVVALFDTAVEWLLGLLEGIIGPHAGRHLPLLGTVFFYILCSNLIGLIPGMSPPTSNLHTNLVIAGTVFVYYNYMGIKAQGLGNYLRHLMGPVIWIAPLLFGIEVISHVVRPFSLSIRLLGNMTADHAVLSVFTDLTKVIVPVVFLGLGLFVCLVQAFVFTLLSAVYIGLAEAHGEEH
ncbi:MAG: F0F1 ATP synthase subunit A [Deltaproteobacteria bacterium]|nr:F0F1 ATP synthase subunit A [Deltaproteobacteria bacterium]